MNGNPTLSRLFFSFRESLAQARIFLLLREVVGVELLDLVDLVGTDAHPQVEVDHQLRQALPVDQDHLGIDRSGVIDRRLREGPSGDEHALLGVFAVQGPDELLDLGTADRALPLLGLQVDDVQAEPVLVDDAVDALVARLPDRRASVPPRAAVAPGTGCRSSRAAWPALPCPGR